jgi:ribose transport system substrate-binding protein
MRTRIRALVCLVVAATATLAACGSTANGPSHTADAATVSAGVAAATANLRKLRTVPTFTPPGPPVDVAKLRGKHIFVIPITETPAGTAIENAEQVVAAEAGIKVTFYPNQGSVADWVKGMQSAVAQRASLIILENAPDPRQLQPQIAAAKSAGIPVLVTHFYDALMPDPPTCAGCSAGVTAVVKAPLSAAATATADWTIADSQGKADVLIVTINGLLPIPSMLAAAQQEYRDDCPDCTVKTVSVDISQVGNGAIGAVSTALAQDPQIDYINPMFDVLIPGTLAAATTANRAGRVKMMSYNGSEFAMKDVANPSSPVRMDVAEPDGWIGYANMDQAFRLLAGMPAVTGATPLRVFDSTNISQAGSQYTGGFGNSYVTGFQRLWGLDTK